MELFTEWCGLVGSWFLVAGPIYQAALELRDEQIESEHIDSIRASFQPPAEISAWWWLLPPIKLILERRRAKVYRQAFLEATSSEDIETMVAFINKATGWLFVAGGGFLLAINETYHVTHDMHWSLLVCLVGIVLLGFVSIAYAVHRINRSKRILSEHKQS